MQAEIAHLLDSLGWAILHSLWQGALAFVAVLCFRALTRDSQAALRYGFQIFCLAASLLAFMGTFAVYQLAGAPSFTSTGTLLGTFSHTGDIVNESSAILTAQAGDISLTPSLNQYAPALGVLWCFGFMLMTLKYSGAFWMTRSLRRHGLSPVPSVWESRFKTLVQNTGIRRTVDFYISNRVSGPITLGFFKPIVLVPASFFSGLSAAQIDAILLHEIAHIRRHDYLINLFQTAIRIVLFFHPAIHYISRKIDHDREHACDDYAVALTKDPENLARGLAALRLTKPIPHLALAADNGQTPLIARIKRLSGARPERYRPETTVLASIAALLFASSVYASTHSAPSSEQTDTALAPPDAVSHPSGAKGNYTFKQITKNEKTFTAKIASDGSRWINVKGMWFDVDAKPAKIASLSSVPVAPAAPKPKAFEEVNAISNTKLQQYKVDLDYYIARLINDTPNPKQADIEGDISLARKLRENVEETISGETAGTTLITPINFDVESPPEPEELAGAAAPVPVVITAPQQERRTDIDRLTRELEIQVEQAQEAERAQQRNLEFAERDIKKIQSALPNKATPRYRSLHDTLMKQLKKARLIDPNAQSVTITYPNRNMAVNGHPVASYLQDPYCDMMAEHGIKKRESTRIQITPGMFEYSTSSWDGSSREHIREKFKTVKSEQMENPWEPPLVSPPAHPTKPVPISFSQPTEKIRISSSFTKTQFDGKPHTGIDLVAPVRTPIKASAPGVVTFAKADGAWGNKITISHANGYETHYAHLNKVCVTEGEHVLQGENIGSVGSTGASTRPHLHFEIHRNGKPQNPEELLGGI
jgi:beta-lactamase regulating signal transducer with metallopeptidase domain